MLRSYFVLLGGFLTGVFLITALLATEASAGMSQDLSVCTAAKDATATAACTRIMKSGRLPDGQMYIAYFNRGTAWRRTGEATKAVADFTKVLELRPGFARAFEARGLAQADLGESSKALSDLDEAVKLGGDDGRFLFSRAVAKRREGDRAGALEDLSSAGALKRAGVQIGLMRALILSEQGDYGQARAEIDKAVAQPSEAALVHYARASVDFAEGRVAEAETAVDRAISLRPELRSARVLKGRILEGRGARAEARTSYEKALAGGYDSFDSRAATKVAKDRLAALGVPEAVKKRGPAVAEAKLEPPRKVDCKVFLPATGSVVTAKCGE